MTTTGLFDRTGVRYEVAQDVLGAIIAHHSEQIAKELEKQQPDLKAIDLANLAKDAMRDLRDSLDPNDAQGIEDVIKRFGPQARDLYATK